MHALTIDAFGGRCTVAVGGRGPRGTAAEAAVWSVRQLAAWHRQFKRFAPGSELSRINADEREVVPASPLMVELAAAVRMAGAATDGIVDGTLLGAIEAAGYAHSRPRERYAPALDHAGLPPRHGAKPGLAPAITGPASASASREWSTIVVDRERGTIRRPPGVRIDSGGLVKGLLADVLCGWLAGYDDVVVDCCGDVRFGGIAAGTRDVEVSHPSGGVATTLDVGDGGVATSGTSARRWTDPSGAAAHHLLDPRSGRPAFTGVAQVSALAPTALEAEVLAKWALLGGATAARDRLTHGGVIITDTGAVDVIPARIRRLAA